MSPLINGFFAQSLRPRSSGRWYRGYARKIILGISDICLRLFFSHVLILNKNPHHFREEVYFTAGRIKVRGKLVIRGKGKRADYILYYKPNQPIAVIEAKDNTHSIGAGIQQ